MLAGLFLPFGSFHVWCSVVFCLFVPLGILGCLGCSHTCFCSRWVGHFWVANQRLDPLRCQCGFRLHRLGCPSLSCLKSRLAKMAGAEPAGQMKGEKLQAIYVPGYRCRALVFAGYKPWAMYAWHAVQSLATVLPGA